MISVDPPSSRLCASNEGNHEDVNHVRKEKGNRRCVKTFPGLGAFSHSLK
jgi:hypothetical protein